MTCREIARELRADMDQGDPGWRERIRALLNEENPGWTTWKVTLQAPNGSRVRITLLANPERIPTPSEIDPATDPFASPDFADR